MCTDIMLIAGKALTGLCPHIFLPPHHPISCQHLPQQATPPLPIPALSGAASHPHAQRAAFVQSPELDELLRHGVEPLIGQDVVVVVVADGPLVQVDGEGPEAVNPHLLAQRQGQADHEEPCGEALGVHVAALPEFPHRAQEFGVGKEHGEVGGGVGEGVVGPDRRLGAGPHGERWHVHVAATVDLHTVHKVFPRPEEALKSDAESQQGAKANPTAPVKASYLFSMMLGLAVTRWVLVPTSSRYSSERGGRLHLNGEQDKEEVLETVNAYNPSVAEVFDNAAAVLPSLLLFSPHSRLNSFSSPPPPPKPFFHISPPPEPDLSIEPLRFQSRLGDVTSLSFLTA